MARLSLCLIARNEESMLPGCLESVRGVVDELVLVDTGSTDRTVALARAAGATVLERPWDDDFAAPRNLAAAHATGDWILQLDADERLHAPSRERLRAALRGRPGFDVGMLRLHNAVRVDAPHAEVVSGALRFGEAARLPRLLRRTPDLRWEGIIHESVLDWARARGGRFAPVDAELIHLGYVPDVHEAREKRRRNAALLRRRVEREPGSVVPLGYLAAELFAAGELDEAAAVADRAWALVEAQPAHVAIRRLAVTRATAALKRNDPGRVLESVDRAEGREGPNPDYDFLRACAHEQQADRLAPGDGARRALLERALAGQRRALERLRAGGWEQVMVAGVPEALARVGALALALGRPEDARDAYRAARDAGASAAVRMGEAQALLALGDPARALDVVQGALAAHPEAWLVAARAAHALGAVADARLFVARARALGVGAAAPSK